MESITKAVADRIEQDILEESLRQLLGQDLLRYGDILTDDMSEDKECPMGWIVRIRTIKYNSHVYYHKMINGEVICVKELT